MRRHACIYASYVHSRHIQLESSTHLVCATRTHRTRRVRSKAVCITCTLVRATRTYMCNVMTKVRHLRGNCGVCTHMHISCIPGRGALPFGSVRLGPSQDSRQPRGTGRRHASSGNEPGGPAQTANALPYTHRVVCEQCEKTQSGAPTLKYLRFWAGGPALRNSRARPKPRLPTVAGDRAAPSCGFREAGASDVIVECRPPVCQHAYIACRHADIVCHIVCHHACIVCKHRACLSIFTVNAQADEKCMCDTSVPYL